MRCAGGDWGKGLIARTRGDIIRKFDDTDVSRDVVLDYIYHCNAAKPSLGEDAFIEVMML